MTKKTITRMLDFADWTCKLDGVTVKYAIQWLQQIPEGAIMRATHDYDEVYGEFHEERLETDEEYAERLAKEAEEVRKREEAQIKEQERLAERKLLQAAKDVAFKAYVEKHKDNPNLGDLSNLCMAVLGLAKAGVRGQAVQPLLECMERLEKEGGTA